LFHLPSLLGALEFFRRLEVPTSLLRGDAPGSLRENLFIFFLFPFGDLNLPVVFQFLLASERPTALAPVLARLPRARRVSIIPVVRYFRESLCFGGETLRKLYHGPINCKAIRWLSKHPLIGEFYLTVMEPLTIFRVGQLKGWVTHSPNNATFSLYLNFVLAYLPRMQGIDNPCRLRAHTYPPSGRCPWES
jgi:hypothetical protein